MSDPNQPGQNPHQPQPGYDPNQMGYDPGQYPPPYSATSPVDPYGGYPPAGLPYDTTGFSANKRPASTIVLGIIGILYAIYLTFCMGIGLAFQSSGGAIFDWLQQSGGMTPEQRAEFEAQLQVTPIQITLTILWILLGILCWVGAIGSLVGKEVGRKALLVFAVCFLLLGVLGLVVEAVRGFPAQQAQVQAQTAGGGPAIPVGVLVAFVFVCGAVFAIYPICVLWFYTRPRIRAWFQRQDIPPVPPAPMYYGQ